MTTPQRASIGEQHAAAYKALIALSSEVGKAAAAAGIDLLLVELRGGSSAPAGRLTLVASPPAAWEAGPKAGAADRPSRWRAPA
ncbi:hypothetical protein [Actinacidiphila sp. bgisy167]|uniref:hypothetical protein n=1 Tax=Actinacidiphila sp. bgisy167 TaxID=3413797 RepID=UPI003D7143A7